MHTKKNAGVSTVIGTSLLIALSVVLISVVTLSVISGVGSFETLEHKVVGFTVEVNDTYGNAVVMPVSGKDLPYLQSYTVYTDTGTTFSSDCDPCKVYHFDANVTYVNIVGNFSDGITALVFSGRVTDDSNIVENQGFVSNSSGYDSLHDLATDINNWYHAYYNTTDDATTLWPGNGNGGGNSNGQAGETHLLFVNSRPIVIASPLEISTDKIISLAEHDQSGLQIKITGNGNFIRAPGYTGSLFIFGYVNRNDTKGVDIFDGNLVIDGDGQNTQAYGPAVVIAYGAPVSISTNGKLTITNNVNTNGNGGGIYIEKNGSLFIANKGTLTVTGNSAKYGGGIYIDGGTIQGSTAGVTGNTATVAGTEDIYPVPSS